MSKRNADKGDSGKKNAATPKEAKPGSAPPASQEKKVRAAGKAADWMSNELYYYLGVILTAIISFYMRAIIPWNRVFYGDRVMFSSETDAWYHMMLAQGTVINLERLFWDPMTNFPYGTPLHFGPLLSWAITIVSYILGLGHPSDHLVEVVGALMPAIFGALMVIPAYFIGRELLGKSCGLLSALLVALLPGQVIRTTLGWTDHHAAEILFSSLTMMFLILALHYGKGMSFAGVQKGWQAFKKPLIYSALTGVALGFYIDAWASGFLFEGVILLFILLQSTFDHIRGRSVEYLGIIAGIAFLVATLLVLPFVDSANGFSNYYYSFFQPTILLLGAVAAIFISLLSRLIRDRGYSVYYYPASLLGLLVLGTSVLYLILPKFTGMIFAGFFIFHARTGGAATVGEAAPLFSEGGVFSFGSVLRSFPGPGTLDTPMSPLAIIFSPFTLALVAMIVIVIRNAKFQRPAEIMILSWSALILVMAIAQNRFTYYYSANVAVLTAFLIIWAMQKAGFESLDKELAGGKDQKKLLISILKLSLAAILIFGLIIMPSYSMSKIYSQNVGGPESDWLTSTAWLQNNTPSPGMELYEKYERPDGEKYPYPKEAYGIMSWWDYGHLIEVVGHRIPNANPFQQGIGSITNNIPGSSPFFLAENESRAEEVLAALDVNRSLYMNTKYVMVDQPMAVGKFHAMAAWSGIPNTRYSGFVVQQQGDRWVPLQTWNEPYFNTITARLYFFDGSETSGEDGIGLAYQPMVADNGDTIPVLTEAPKITKNRTELMAFIDARRSSGDLAMIASINPANSAFPTPALQHYRLVHESESAVTTEGQKLVKIFEHVPGAIVRGNAPPGTRVSAQVGIVTNRNRPFLYQQSNISDADGRFTLVLPYSTEGPIANGTNFDTKPMSAYLLNVGGQQSELRVPEEYVLSGEVISI
ncbi:MAG: oligosaccharyl transferase, archaeosortase A system-associated [Methanothrix sp.]|nr:oligosaccharyl transferase, archaeosortase A system-associated [Methanothrix sp.]